MSSDAHQTILNSQAGFTQNLFAQIQNLPSSQTVSSSSFGSMPDEAIEPAQPVQAVKATPVQSNAKTTDEVETPSYALPMSPLALSDSNLLKWATSWTKRRLFTDPVTKKNSTNADCDLFPSDEGIDQQHTVSYPTPASGPDSLGRMRICLGHGPDGYVLTAYPGCGKIQVWKHDHNELLFVGSTQEIEGKILRADILASSKPGTFLVVQISKRRETILQVFTLKSSEFIENNLLVLPSRNSGPGPYYVFSSYYSDYFAIVTSNGLVTLFDQKNQKSLPVYGIECNLGSDGRPLFDIHGRWIAFSPKASSESSSQRHGKAYDVPRSAPEKPTPVLLSPKNSLHERLIDSLSNTAAASLKSLSDKGKASLRQYLNGDRAGRPRREEKSNGLRNSNSRYGYFSDDYYYYDDDNEGQKKKSNDGTDSTGLSSDFKNMIFGDPNSAKKIHVFDMVSEKTLACFSTLNGTSAISLSPYDCTLACVSANGEAIDTYDLSFLPRRVIFSSRLTRGRSYATCQRIAWDRGGGVGLSTWDKGSVHWFDKSRSLDRTNKIWKCSAWDIEDMSCKVASDENEEALLFARQGQVLVIDPHTGNCDGKFDMPLEPFEPDIESSTTNSVILKLPEEKVDKLEASGPTDATAEFELETCLPYPYIHTDKDVIMRIIDFEAMNASGDGKIVGETFVFPVFGVPIKSETVVFSNATKTEGVDDDAWENIDEEHTEAIGSENEPKLDDSAEEEETVKESERADQESEQSKTEILEEESTENEIDSS